MKEFEDADDISISLDVDHLRFWFLQPMPTYLAVYIESVDKFLVVEIQAYITEEWGVGIVTLEPAYMTRPHPPWLRLV